MWRGGVGRTWDGVTIFGIGLPFVGDLCIQNWLAVGECGQCESMIWMCMWLKASHAFVLVSVLDKHNIADDGFRLVYDSACGGRDGSGGLLMAFLSKDRASIGCVWEVYVYERAANEWMVVGFCFVVVVREIFCAAKVVCFIL